MLGTAALTRGSDSSAANRVFIYEVEGLRQSEETDRNNYQVRSSSTIQIQVPYSRMNEEMRRINRLGGKIVSIRSASDPAPAKSAPVASDSVEDSQAM